MKIAPVSATTVKNTFNFKSNNANNVARSTDENRADNYKKANGVFAFLASAAILVCVSYPLLRRKTLELEGSFLKKTIQKARNSIEENVLRFQKKADEVSNLIKQGRENSFADVYEDSKLIRKFSRTKKSKVPNVMKEYSQTSGELLRKTVFKNSENFDCCEYHGSKDVLDLFKVRKNKPIYAACNLVSYPSDDATCEKIIWNSDFGKIMFDGCFIKKEKNTPIFFEANNGFAFLGKENQSLFKKIRIDSDTFSCNKAFGYKNGILNEAGVSASFQKGFAPDYEELYRRNKEGKMIGIQTREIDINETLEDITCSLFFD